MAERTSLTWMAFVAMTFGVVGIMSVFATYAGPVPLYRALARDAALDEVLAASGSADQGAKLAALAPELGDSAAAITEGSGTLEERISRERTAMRARFIAEAHGLARRLRLMIVIVTVVCAGFACAIVGGLSRRPVP